MEQWLETEVRWLEQASTLDQADGRQEAEGDCGQRGRNRHGRDLPVRDGDVGHADQCVAGFPHRLPRWREWVLCPHVLHVQCAALPAPVILRQSAADPTRLELVHRQDDVGEELHRLGIQREAKLQARATLVAIDGGTARELDQVTAGREQRRLHRVGAGHILTPFGPRAKGAYERGNGAGGDQRADGTVGRVTGPASRAA